MRERGPGYGLRGPRHDRLQATISTVLACGIGAIVGIVFESFSLGILVGLLVFGICFGLG